MPWRILLLSLALTAAALRLVPTRADSAGCVDATPAVAGMETATLTANNHRLPVRVADEAHERQAGMQWLCPAAVAETVILFLLPSPERAYFHMENVRAPLDIAFLDERGVVVEIQRMTAGMVVQARQPVSAALEAPAGAFAAWDLAVGDRLRWEPMVSAATLRR